MAEDDQFAMPKVSAHAHCSHSQVSTPSEGRLRLAIGLTLGFVGIEVAVGLWSQSLALVSDAGHNFTDAVALVISWLAIRASRLPSNARRTFGYHRIGILATLINATSLVLLALFIFWEAYHRFHSPLKVQPWPMIVVALMAVALNTVISTWLHADAKHDLNVRGAYLHMIGDAISAVGVVVAGLIVVATGSPLADPLISVVIGCLILLSSWGILLESIDVLLESVPRGLDMPGLEQSLREVPQVVGIHDLHVWTIASKLIACSCHLVVNDQSVRSGQQISKAACEMLRERFGVTHATLQIEADSCEPSEIFCTLEKSGR